ncbi:Voltage-dependent calcium channel subunit alpha-2/delta-3 [Schistosoma japonicum]|uniref:Voltage-dependent calcium channel subunit alpha-2/delta-3 n=1 Tax=Schistosoma japonicum TaxID=6182 RepID=A0A4Z2DHK5_SCHJA|nr:Voltage-dependent calcium channel subunit alpha-2/delta-3 [Schistosoma japonicum]
MIFFHILWILLQILVITRSYDDPIRLYHDVKQNFDRWVIELSQSFSELQTVSAEPYLKSIYKTANFESKEINETVATGYLQTAIEKIQNIVNEKSKLVDNIKIAAEEAFVNRDGNEPTGCYYRAKALTIVPPLNETDNCSVKFYIPLKQSPQHDNQYVCYNFSVAHVPTNVYDLSDKLKRIGNWTTELDKVFKLNAQSDPTLKWQYFGSSTGFFRYYPGAMWEIQLDEYRLDFFDCRSQPWYLQASAYPKEMIILIDKSGSMKGRSDIISNATAAEILNTLTENDYFNVMMFSDNTMYADPLITDRLVQATKYNKDKMIKTFRKFTPNGTASYENAITEVFRLFNKVDENFHTNHKCNRMVMIITDSAPGSYEHLFKEFNPQKNVRVFTYLLGQHSSAEEYVQELACLNRGYAVNIATLADVKENVLKYLDVIARSNALQDDAYFVWTGATVHQFNFKKLKRENFTNPYLMNTHSSRSFMNGFMQNMLLEPDPVRIDTMIASKEELPKMYTSVAKAVYDKTNKAKRLKEGNLLGVAGVDVPLQSFQDTLRGWKIGVNNYLFAVDNNGFVLFHPNYRPVYKALLKSYYQNVDINEVEVMKEVKIDPWSGTPEYNTTLRNAMINRERTSVDMDVNMVVDNYHTTFEVKKKFFISPIDQTPFTLGLAIQWDPTTNKGYPIPEYRFNSQELLRNLHVNDFSCFAPKYGEQNTDCNSHGNDSQIGSTIIPYEFCQFNKDLASLYLKDRLCAFRQILLNSSLISRLKCDEEYLSRIYLDAKMTCDLSNYWFKQSKSHLITKWNIQQAFSFHHSGLIRFYNFTTPAYPHFITDHIGGVEDSLYSETVQTSRYLSEDNVLVFHTPPNDLFRHFSSEKLDVPVTLTTSVFREPVKTPMGIIGLQITHSAIQNEFNRITNTCFTGECHVCGSPGFDCYIINQAAMVLVSNVGEKEVGQNLKEINCALVEDLVNHSVLNETYLYDFQGICIETVQETPNAGNHLYPPLQFVLKIIIWFINETVLFVFGFIDLLSYRIVNGQKWSIYSEPEESIDKEYPDTLSSYQSRNPPEDFMVHQNLLYYGIDEKIKNRDSPYHNLPDQHIYESSQLNNAIQSHIYTPEKQPINDNQKHINNKLHNDRNQDKSIMGTSETTQMTSTSLHNQSEMNLITESILVPELKEEPIDGLFGRIDQDPYDAQLRALTAIETCRKEQTAHIQSILDSQSENTITSNTTDEFINYTDSTTASPINLGSTSIGKGGKLVPGSLLACVHRSVQQRCHSGAGTSSFTGRYACEAICEVVRERMPQLANRLEDCKQPLTPCTERFVTYNVVPQNLKKFNSVINQVTGTHDISPINEVSSVNELTGEYCSECGGRRWLMKRLPNTNLFLLMNIVLSGSQSILCKCNCRKQFRYGARLVIDKSKPRPVTYRKYPPIPSKCRMIDDSLVLLLFYRWRILQFAQTM